LGSGLEDLPLASLLVDSSGHILDANREAVVLLGQSLSAPAGNLSEIFGTGWLADLTEGRSMAARRIDGAQIEVLGFAKRGSEGRLLISLVDVTVRARRERELA
jgi:PAS domain-containing protein